MRTRTIKPDGDKISLVWKALVALEGTSKGASSANIIELVRKNKGDPNFPPSTVHGVINWLHYACYIEIDDKVGGTILFKTRGGIGTAMPMSPSFAGKPFVLGGAEHRQRIREGNEEIRQRGRRRFKNKI